MRFYTYCILGIALLSGCSKPGTVDIFQAVEQGNLEAIERALDAEADIEMPDEAGRTPLMLAFQSGRDAAAILLLERGAALFNADTDGIAPLLLAVQTENADLVRAVLDAGTDVNAGLDNGKTALHEAFTRKNEEVAILLIERGANVHKSHLEAFYMSPPLVQAVVAEMPNALLKLLERGATIDVPSIHHDDQPLLIAARYGNLDIVKVLIDHGAAIDENTGAYFSRTALQIAAAQGDLPLIEFLVAKGASLAPEYGDVTPPFVLALNNGHTEVADYLFQMEENTQGEAMVGGIIAAPPKNYLSLEWAQFMNINPGGSRESVAAMEQAMQQAKELQKQGFAEYRRKNDRRAVELYEQALDNHATAGIYYNYANSLSNIPRLEDSIKAYEIALELKHPESYLVLYNTACAYSRLQKKEPALRYLRRAVAEGYNAFAYMQRDGDLAFMRAQPEWSRWMEELQSGLLASSVTQSEEGVFKRLYIDKRLISKDANRVIKFTANPNTAEYNLGDFHISVYDENREDDLWYTEESGSFRLQGNLITLLNAHSYLGFTRTLRFEPDGPERIIINGVVYEVK